MQKIYIYTQRYTDITDIRWYTDVSPFHTWLQALIRDRQMSLPQIWNVVLSIQDHQEIPSCSNAMNQAIRFAHGAFILRTLAFSEVWAAAPQSEKCPASEATCPTPPWVTMKSVDMRCTMHKIATNAIASLWSHGQEFANSSRNLQVHRYYTLDHITSLPLQSWQGMVKNWSSVPRWPPLIESSTTWVGNERKLTCSDVCQ